MEVALATNTAPRDWWHESDEVIATALDVLEKQAARMARRTRRK